jgi:hypothetical protein
MRVYGRCGLIQGTMSPGTLRGTKCIIGLRPAAGLCTKMIPLCVLLEILNIEKLTFGIEAPASTLIDRCFSALLQFARQACFASNRDAIEHMPNKLIALCNVESQKHMVAFSERPRNSSSGYADERPLSSPPCCGLQKTSMIRKHRNTYFVCSLHRSSI